MRVTPRLLSVAVGVAAIAACHGGRTVPERTVEDLVGRHVAAVGGDTALEALRSWRLLSKVDGLTGAVGYIETSAKLPDRVRIASVVGTTGKTLIFDGQNGWIQGSGAATRIADTKVERLRASVFLDVLLACRRDPSCRTTVGPIESFAGTPCYTLDVAWPHGYSARVSLDSRTFLIARTVTGLASTGPRGQMTVETAPSRYQTVRGLTVPSAIRVSGAQGAYTLTVAKFEANPELDDALFTPSRAASSQRQ